MIWVSTVKRCITVTVVHMVLWLGHTWICKFKTFFFLYFFLFYLNLDKFPSDFICIWRFFLPFLIWIWDIKRWKYCNLRCILFRNQRKYRSNMVSALMLHISLKQFTFYGLYCYHIWICFPPTFCCFCDCGPQTILYLLLFVAYFWFWPITTPTKQKINTSVLLPSPSALSLIPAAAGMC